MAAKNDYYSYRVTWSDQDSEYVGLCAEFPSLSWLDKTPEKALIGIRRTVAQVIGDMHTHRETPPEPVARKYFSGKFMVRVPPLVHRKLALEAADAGVSMNRLVSAKLAG